MSDRKLAPVELARQFADLGDHEQAEFFSQVACESDEWPDADPDEGDRSPFEIQMRSVRGCPELTLGGLKVMRVIGEYADEPKT